MNKRILLFVLISYGSLIFAAQILPSIPQSGSGLSDFIPDSWQISKKAEGDLNRDGEADIAVVIEEKPSDEWEESPRRILLILLKKGSQYTLSIKSERAILKADEGGVMGDPFQTLSCSRGSLLIGFYGGSRERWGFLLRFRLQDEGWALIGITRDLIDSLTGDGKSDDINLLTGQVITRIKKYEKPDQVEKSNRGRRELVLLKDFIAYNIESLKY